MVIETLSEQCAMSFGVDSLNANISVAKMMPSIIPANAFEEFGTILFNNSKGRAEPTFFKISEIVEHSSGVYMQVFVDCAVFTNENGIPNLVHSVSTKMRPLGEKEIPLVGKTLIPRIELMD